MTLSGMPLVAPETNWKTGEMETGGIPPFRGFDRSFRSFAKSFRQEVLSSLFYWRTSLRTSCDTCGQRFLPGGQVSGRNNIQPRQEEGRAKRLKRGEACYWQSFMYLVKPLHCDLLLYRQVIMYTALYVYCTLGRINSWFWDMLSHG